MRELEELFWRQPGLMGMEEYERSSVLIPLIHGVKEDQVLFEVRSGKLKKQPGEICFPGGRIEGGESPLEAAVRETAEELSIEPGQIRLLGPTDLFLSPANVMIHPFLAVLLDYEGTFSPDEVQEIFTVPLSFFVDREPEAYKARVTTVPGDGFPYDRIPGGMDYRWREGRYQVNFYQYGDRVIWGMTAKIVHSAAKLLRPFWDGEGRIGKRAGQ